MNEIEEKEGLYRQNVSAIIIDGEGNFLLEQKEIYNSNEWGWIGGGVEPGEDLLEALFREIEEELGLSRDDFEVVGLSSHENRYKFGPEFLAKVQAEGSSYIGQVKKIYVLRYKGDKSKITADHPTIRRVTWVTREQLSEFLVFDGQLEHAESVIAEMIRM